eukprot:84886_1
MDTNVFFSCNDHMKIIAFIWIFMWMVVIKGCVNTTLHLPHELIKHSLMFLSTWDQINKAQLSCKLFHKCWIENNECVLKDIEYLTVVLKTLDQQLLDKSMVRKLYLVHKKYFNNFQTFYLFKLAKCMHMSLLPQKQYRLLGFRRTHRFNVRAIAELFIPELASCAKSLVHEYFTSSSYAAVEQYKIDTLKIFYFVFIPFTYYSNIPLELKQLIDVDTYKAIYWFEHMIKNELILNKHNLQWFLTWFWQIQEKFKRVLHEKRIIILQSRFLLHYLRHFTQKYEVVASEKEMNKFVDIVHYTLLQLAQNNRYDLFEMILLMMETSELMLSKNGFGNTVLKCYKEVIYMIKKHNSSIP